MEEIQIILINTPGCFVVVRATVVGVVDGATVVGAVPLQIHCRYALHEYVLEYRVLYAR